LALTRRTSRSRFTLVLLILTSITLLTLDARNFGPVESVRRGVLSVLAPVGDAFGGLFDPVRDAWDGATGYDELASENDDLRARIAELEGQIASGQAAQAELDQLKAQLDLPFVNEIPVVRATVTSGAIGNFDQTIEIDKGSDQGIREGMPIVSGAGLVGEVVEVTGGRSVVRLVSDPAFQAGVRKPGTDGLGVVRGQGDGGRLRATFDLSAELAEGDLLVTSGASRSQFPPDVPVGRVTSVTRDETALETRVELETLSSLSDLTYVTALLYEPTA
jgi:rod shape-determining protein MreC